MPLPVTKLHIYDALEGAEISPLLFSNFMEQLGYSADGGALAQLRAAIGSKL